MKFKSEKDVRKWCREQAQLFGEEKCLFWVEPKKGSTFGFPDLLYAKGGKLVPFELKLGQIANNVLVWKPRSSQAICTAKMILAGVDVFTIVGLKNTEKIVFLHARESFLGKSTNWQEISGFEEIWKQIRSGSKFLFSSSFKTLEEEREKKKRGEFRKQAGKKNLEPFRKGNEDVEVDSDIQRQNTCFVRNSC